MAGKESIEMRILLAVLCALLAACGGSSDKVTVKVDGSSTVFLITEAVAVEFQKERDDIAVDVKYSVTVGYSGTGGGFEKFYGRETDINDASRAITDEEIKRCREAGIDFIELPVAYDGLSVVVHKDNDFVDYLTTRELNMIWKLGSRVTRWSQVREGWPDEEIKLFGPGGDSGTFDYFTEVINKRRGACRSDFSKNEDDNVLVTGVAGDRYALGYFGFVYYKNNRDKLRAVPIDNGNGPVSPTFETIKGSTYKPLARPLYIYVSTEAAKRPEVRDFVHYYLKNAPKLVKLVGYVPLPAAMYEEALKRFDAGTTGRASDGG